MNASAIIKNSALLILALVIAIASGELIIRLKFNQEVDTETLTVELRSRSIKLITTPSKDPTLFYELKPHLNIIDRGNPIVTGADAYRIPHEYRSTSPDAFQIAVIGDSTSFGWKVPYEESYPAVFTHKLSNTLGKPFELKNYSVPGYNTIQEVQLFETRVLEDPPDLLILHHDPNDSAPSSDFQPPSYLHPEYGDNPFNSALIKFILRRYQIKVNAKNREYDHSQHKYLNGHIISGPLYDQHLNELRRLKKIADAHSIPVIAVLYSSEIIRDDTYSTNERYIHLHRNLFDMLTEFKYYVLDLYPRYQEELKRRNWNDLSPWWISSKPPIDGHPNTIGHRFIADQLYDLVISKPDLLSNYVELPKKSALKSQSEELPLPVNP